MLDLKSLIFKGEGSKTSTTATPVADAPVVIKDLGQGERGEGSISKVFKKSWVLLTGGMSR